MCNNIIPLARTLYLTLNINNRLRDYQKKREDMFQFLPAASASLYEQREDLYFKKKL